jgi:type II secretory pathway pseudopilin PulG
VIDPRAQKRRETGFTLIEAMIAMGLFAIASLMLIPAVFTWTYANNIGKQRQRATEILEATANQKRQESWSNWSSPVTKSTYSATLAAAQSCLGNQISSGSATCASGGIAFTFPDGVGRHSGKEGGYAIAETVVDGQEVSRVMVLRLQWQDPRGATQAVNRVVQRNNVQ